MYLRLGLFPFWERPRDILRSPLLQSRSYSRFWSWFPVSGGFLVFGFGIRVDAFYRSRRLLLLLLRRRLLDRDTLFRPSHSFLFRLGTIILTLIIGHTAGLPRFSLFSFADFQSFSSLSHLLLLHPPLPIPNRATTPRTEPIPNRLLRHRHTLPVIPTYSAAVIVAVDPAREGGGVAAGAVVDGVVAEKGHG